jgi:hypothetical protein
MLPKEIVIRAIERRNPPRLPLLFLNKDLEKSDILFTGYAPPVGFHPANPNLTEWGYEWERLDETMGQPKRHPIPSWEALSSYRLPDPHAPGRYDHIPAFVEANKEKYLVGGLGITGFNQVTFLRGFANTLEDFYLNPDQITGLVDQVFSFEMAVIEHYSQFGLDAVAFGDDWGTQRDLMISPALWRKLFKPRYKAQFDLVHQHGMHVYFHCCGYIYSIIPDLIEIGADILNLNQPDLLGVERLGQDFGGKVCFCCPVDHQTVALSGSRQEIFAYIQKLENHLGCFNGGFIGYIEEYHSIGMSAANYQSIVDAFESSY